MGIEKTYTSNNEIRFPTLPAMRDMFDKSQNGKYFEDVPLTHDADGHPLVRDEKGNWKEAKRDKEGNWVTKSGEILQPYNELSDPDDNDDIRDY